MSVFLGDLHLIVLKRNFAYAAVRFRHKKHTGKGEEEFIFWLKKTVLVATSTAGEVPT